MTRKLKGYDWGETNQIYTEMIGAGFNPESKMI